jgi:hypothetical protein
MILPSHCLLPLEMQQKKLKTQADVVELFAQKFRGQKIVMYIVIYIHCCWELMKSVGSHGCSSSLSLLLFMMSESDSLRLYDEQLL